MSRFKKLLSAMISLVMVFAFTPVLAFGAQEGTLEDGEITVENPTVGETYSIYQILYLESYNADTNAYAYKANSAWADWLGEAAQQQYVSIDGQGYVTWVENADAAAFAKAAIDHVNASNVSISNDGSKTPSAESPAVSFTGLKLGYYLLDSTMGTLCSLDTTNPVASIKEKNDEPTIDKQVQEDSNAFWGDVNDADINQVVNFKSTVAAKAGASNYVVHDKMSSGLTFTGVSKINDGTKDLVVGEDYSVVTDGLDAGCTFHIVFAQAYLNTIAADTDIVIEYAATVNENAVVAGEGNSNETWLDYGNAQETTHDKTTTYIWNFDILKFGNGDEGNVLADAQFVLLNNDKSKVATIIAGKISEWVNVPEAGQDGEIAWPVNTTLTTDEKGKISISGLDADDYNLREIKAPDGYNRLADDQAIKITASSNNDGTMTFTPFNAKINNQSGTLMPGTGGIGTTIFYIVGAVLVVGALIYFVRRNRSASKKD